MEKHDLKMGEFVVFEQVSRMHFEVSIYDTTSCKKNPSAVEVPEEQELLALNGDGHVEHVKSKCSKGINSHDIHFSITFLFHQWTIFVSGFRILQGLHRS